MTLSTSDERSTAPDSKNLPHPQLRIEDLPFEVFIRLYPLLRPQNGSAAQGQHYAKLG